MLLGFLLVPTVGLVGDIVTEGAFRSTKGSEAGAPLVVNSTDMVANLNADMVDGVEGTNLYTKAEVDAMFASIAVEVEPRKYYLTELTYDGDEADDACGAGYHMAALYEIAHPTSLQYEMSPPGGALTYGDSGSGPPSGMWGWIRTGFVPQDVASVGTSNCSGWTSNASGQSGTAVILPTTWSNPLGDAQVLIWGAPWAAGIHPCDADKNVWCIED
jgi:hypothetical protein